MGFSLPMKLAHAHSLAYSLRFTYTNSRYFCVSSYSPACMRLHVAHLVLNQQFLCRVIDFTRNSQSRMQFLSSFLHSDCEKKIAPRLAFVTYAKIHKYFVYLYTLYLTRTKCTKYFIFEHGFRSQKYLINWNVVVLFFSFPPLHFRRL